MNDDPEGAGNQVPNPKTLPGINGHAGRILVPCGRDAHVIARIRAGQDVTAGEISRMADPTCGMVAGILAQSRGRPDQQEKALADLLRLSGIDEGEFHAAVLRADPTVPFVDPWPAPIRSGLPDSVPFPLDSLPRRIVRGFVAEAAASIGCPVDFVGTMALVALGAATGNAARLELKPGYLVSTSLYAANVGEPGDGKTAALAAVDEPFRAVQDEMLRDHRRLVDQWKVDRAAAKQAGTPVPDPPDDPGRVLARDFTIEALIRKLAKSSRGLLVSVDEVSGLLGGLNQYKGGGKGNDLQKLLEIWSNITTILDRVSHADGIPVLYVSNPFLGIGGGINTANLVLFYLQKGTGLPDRFLFAYPDPAPIPDWTWAGLPVDRRKEWGNLIRRLLGRGMDQGQYGQPIPHIYRFDRMGREAWKDLYHRHVAEMRKGDFPPELRGPWSKFREYAGRLALNLALAELATGTDLQGYRDHDTDNKIADFHWEDAIIGAWNFVDYFKSQVRRVHAKVEKLMPNGVGVKESQDVEEILRWIEKNRRAMFQAKDLEDLRCFRGKTGRRDGTLGEMEQRHLIRRTPEAALKGTKKPSPTFEVSEHLRTWETPPTNNRRDNRQADPQKSPPVASGTNGPTLVEARTSTEGSDQRSPKSPKSPVSGEDTPSDRSLHPSDEDPEGRDEDIQIGMPTLQDLDSPSSPNTPVPLPPWESPSLPISEDLSTALLSSDPSGMWQV